MVMRQPIRASVLKGKRPVPPMRSGANLVSNRRPPGEEIRSWPKLTRKIRRMARRGGAPLR